MSIYAEFQRVVAAKPASPALIDGATGAVTTLAELLDRADATARELSTRRLAPGDCVAIQLPNSAGFIASFVAARKLELTVVPIDRDARRTEVEQILDHFEIRALLYAGDRTSADSLTISMREGSHRTEPHAGAPLAVIKLTSGSTGSPRGIATTDANLVADCNNICESMGISSTDRNFGAIPFSHSYGFSNLVTPLLIQGTTIVVSNDYLPLSILDLCNRLECTLVPGIPMMYDHLSRLPADDGDFTTIRTFISAGAPLLPAVSKRFRERYGIPIHSFYGCSECGGISYDRKGASVERGSVGGPLEGVTIRLESHRLVVASEAVAHGYIAGADDESRFSNGRFTTDDLASVNADGELELTGRASDLINTAGKKVNPREVERVILECPGVRDVKVYGEDAGARGQVVAAAVVASPEATRESIRLHCREHLAAHKVPRIVKLIDAIPLDERGKVKRSALALLASVR